MRSAPLWFGDPERRLFGWLDVPDDGRARAGVVLCPPLAVEQTSSKSTLAQLSGRLADEGFAVLRFDYDGTGDSAGRDDESHRLDAWLGSVRSAVRTLGGLGCTRTAVVGLRMGALLAMAELQREPGVDALVLWDPCVSGRSFMRQQTALRRMVGRGEILDDGSVECLGMVLPSETATELLSLDLGDLGTIAARMLVLTRTRRAVPERVRERLDGPGTEWVEIEGQEALVDVEPVRVVVPESTLERIVGWLGEALDGDPVRVTLPDPEWAVVGRAPDGRAIRERAVLLGPDRLFGIETLSDGPNPGSPTALFLNAGVIDHVGPGRSWVVIARELAARGMRSVRFDLSGIGASPARTATGEGATRAVEGLEDVAHAQAAVSPHDPADVVLVGLCSGGYHASEAALSTGARGVAMINPSFRISDESTTNAVPDSDGERQVAESPKGWIQRIPARDLLWKLARRAPDAVWRIINRFGVDHPPAETLTRLALAEVDVLVACDEYDVGELQRGGHRALAPYQRDRRLQVVVIAGMDHTLFCRQPRVLTCDLIVDHLIGRFVPTITPTSGAGRPAPETSVDGQGNTGQEDHDLVGR